MRKKVAKKVTKKKPAKRAKTKDENPRIVALRTLIEKNKITSFSQIFLEKHFYVLTLATLMKKTAGWLTRCINDPGRFRYEDVITIARILGIEDESKISNLIVADHERIQDKSSKK